MRFPYGLKLDVRKYFDSIDHGVLKTQIGTLIKDPVLLDLLDRIINNHSVAPGKGLPIGSLCSQHFANLYLSTLDRYAKQTLRCKGYLRYMDDIAVFGQSRKYMREVEQQLRERVKQQLKLDFKPALFIPVNRGVPWLGRLIRPEGVDLLRKNRIRWLRGVKTCERKYAAGCLSDHAVQRSLSARCAAIADTRTTSWRRRVLHGVRQGEAPSGKARPRARTASTGVAAGITTPGTAVPPTATGTGRTTGTTTWACALPSARSAVEPQTGPVAFPGEGAVSI